MEECGRQAQSRVVPKFDKGELEKLDAKREDILVAVGHLSFKNSFDCELEARRALAFDLGTLDSAKKAFKVDDGSIDKIQGALVYPSVRELDYSAKYIRLPSKLKKYMEQTIGEKPFDLLSVLEANELLLE